MSPKKGRENTSMDYRHEWKHIITAADRIALRQRLQAVCKPDRHGTNGRYLVRSLYFDNLQDKALREKLEGVSRREKFRIRCYDHDHTFIRLECKRKLAGLGHKDSCPLSTQEVQAIGQGELQWMVQDERTLVQELYSKMRTQGLQPRTLVEYTREAYLFPAGNVRVTLDYDIRTGLGCTDLLDRDCPTVAVPDDPILLEVKWDAFLPDIIRDAIQLEDVRTTAFSKYAACRRYD